MIKVDSYSYKIVFEPTEDDTEIKAELHFECIGDPIELERLISTFLAAIVSPKEAYNNKRGRPHE